MYALSKGSTEEEVILPLKRPTVYLESYDSVRFSGTSLDDECLIYPTLETILHILKGDLIEVPEPYSFDSCAFLAIASKALEARRENPIIHRGANIYWNPFHLTLRKDKLRHNSYINMLREYFSRPADTIVLSAWNDLLDKKQLQEMVDSLEKHEKPPDFLEGDDYRYRGLFYLKEYFDQVSWSRKVPLKRQLGDFYNLLCNNTESGAFGEESTYRESLIESFSTLKKHHIPLNNRSQVRILGKNWLPEDDLRMVLEFIDTSYNMILSEFSGNRQPSFCTNQQALGHQAVYGEALAYRVNSIMNRNRKGVAQPTSISIEGGKQYSTLASAVDSTQLWQRVWDIVNSSDWLHIRYQLNELENENKQNTPEYEKLYDKFLQFISTEMADISVKRNEKVKRIGITFKVAQAMMYVTINALNMLPNFSAASMHMPTIFQALTNYTGQMNLQNQADFFLDYYKYAMINSANRQDMTFGLVQSLLRKI